MSGSIERSVATAFVVVAARPGHCVPGHVRAVLQRSEAPSLPFVATKHHHWSNAHGNLHLAVWDAPSEASNGRWVLESDSCAVVAGHYRAQGEPWRVGSEVTRTFVDRLRLHGARSCLEDADGAFTAAMLDDQFGLVAADPMGFGSLFGGSNSDVAAFGTRAELVAWAIAPEGARPSKDPLAACWTAFSPHAIGGRSGFEGVQQLTEGTEVHLRPDAEVEFVRRPAPWLDNDQLRALRPEDLLDIVDTTIRDGIAACLNLPVEQRYMDLTGGKDSRLLLAVAVGAGMADQFMIQTAGPGDLRDVEIASGLTSLLGLDHRTGFLWPIDRRPYPEQVATFVELTTGTVNLWDLKLPRSSPAELRVSGMTGECLRAYVPLPATPSDDRRLLEIVRMKFLRGTLPLLLPETRFTLDRELEAALLEPDIACDDPLDRLGSFMIRNRARRPRGSMDELETDFRVWPLASLPAVRAAFALGSERRQGEYVHRKLIERHSTELAEYAFAGPGWSASAEGPKAAPSDPPAISPTAAPNRQKSEPVLKRGHRQLRDMRKTLLETVFADTRNPIWDLVDRNAAVSGLATFDELSMKQLRQLCAVGTAALWLAT